MERGFLSSSSMNKKDNGEDKTKKGSVFSDLASKITNIDGKMIGKDGKPLRAVRRVVFQEPISVAEVSEADQACMQNVSNTPSHPVVDKNVERIVEDVSTDADVSDAMRSDCNNDGSSGEAANVDKNAASGNVNGISSFASLVRPNSANSKVNSVNGISQRKEGSFASLLRPKEVTNKLRFRTLVNKEKVECSDCVLPKAAANLVKSRYENSIIGFFVGKDPSFPVVQNYVSNTWSKFGFKKITRNDNGVYLFKFASKAGLEQVLERGPRMIPYSEDGLSLIATQIASTLKKEVIMAILEEEGDGHIKEFIRVEYEWRPPHCVKCKSFGHSHDLCPKRVRDEVPKAPSMAVKPSTMEDNEEGFVEAVETKFKSPSGTTKESDKGVKVSSPSRANQNMITPLSNSFDVLNTAEKEDVQNPKVNDHAGKENAKSKSSKFEDESDDDEVYMPHGGGFADGMEDDLECYYGYGTHVRGIKWLEVGDSNSAFFHKSVKSRNQRSRMDSIRDTADCEVTGSLMEEFFVNHYQQFLRTNLECDDLDSDAMFSIGDDRAPGPNGFTSAFFKRSWDIVGNDVCRAVREFFNNGQLLKEINHTFLALIPKGSGSSRCAFKVDIQKAYDTVDWKFLSNILNLFGFHKKMVKWIMACVSSASFSLCINRDIHGYFNGKRGLRQDDLFIFTRGEVHSARLIMEALDEFQKSSGLVPSIPKSTVYLCNVPNYIKNEILSIIPFAKDELPVKYLGVPLISSRLLNKDCKVLVEKVSNRIRDWKNKSLSYAGRLQLCRSVLSSMHVYWAAVLVIPIGIIQDIKQLMRGFLWCNGELKRGKAKVAWDIICLPKREGGLVKADMSWGWRKLLQIHKFVKPFFWKKIGNGKSTSLWFDRWNVQCPLINYLTPRDITNEGFTLKTCVADIVSNEGWLWPQSWLLKAPNLATVAVPNLVDTHVDLPRWRDSKGVLSMFSVRGAWEALRPRDTEVAWYHIVWFSHNIPRYAFNLWLVMRRSLKTQDRVRQWDGGPNVDLSTLRYKLCDAQPDSQEHLFFECPYSARIWILIRSLASMELISPMLHDIISYLQPIAHRRNARSVIGRILIAAAAYFI
ncbi:hypothetical protein Tco_1283886 [Tanacetum coccineum]